jgi:Rad3-related DNA helicase
MRIDLKDKIVIIDEAHNIENSCREEASCIIEKKKLDVSIVLINIILKRDSRTDSVEDKYPKPKKLFDKKQTQSALYIVQVFENLIKLINDSEIKNQEELTVDGTRKDVQKFLLF